MDLDPARGIREDLDTDLVPVDPDMDLVPEDPDMGRGKREHNAASDNQ